MIALSPNSGHTATVLRTFSQIRQSRTSYVRHPLSEMPTFRVHYIESAADVTKDKSE